MRTEGGGAGVTSEHGLAAASRVLRSEQLQHEYQLLALEATREAQYCGLFSDQLADAFGVVGVTTQVLCSPSYVSWEALDGMKWTYGNTIASCVIQLGVQLCMRWLLVVWLHKSRSMADEREGSELMLYRRAWQRLWGSWGYFIFCFGVMLHFSMTFWPKCSLCSMPKTCLLYLECLRDGEVTIGGLNYCNWEDSWVMPTPNSTQVVDLAQESVPSLTVAMFFCDKGDDC